MMHSIYLPFTEKQLLSHFVDVRQDEKINDKSRHIQSYKKSIENYKKYCEQNPYRQGNPVSKMKQPCQIEKDEKFWTSSSLMTIYYSDNSIEEFCQLLRKAYGDSPPIDAIDSWEECLGDRDDLELFFEANLPSPNIYKKHWLKENLKQQQFIPYILQSAANKKIFEGATNVDAILINSANGFAVIIEAKVLSDISYDITYDTKRNQIARNIDVMLEKNHNILHPLNKRDPEKSLFLLLTPDIFKKDPPSRLYYYKYHGYKSDPNLLSEDLPHRENFDWKNISDRLGWLTWEDFKFVNSNCCLWLNEKDK